MKWTGMAGVLALLLLAAWWLGRHSAHIAAPAPAAAQVKPAPRILYYRNPMGAPDISPLPKKDEMGMDYLPVYAPEKPAARQILYYRNPMGAADISKTPKQDEMGMDYLPVYADAEALAADSSEIHISTDKVQKLGVQTEVATRRLIGRSLQTTGRLAVDERRVRLISPRFEGWIERLHVDGIGQRVAPGQILFVAYMHELYDAELAYRNAVRASMEPDLAPAVYKERELLVLTRLRQLERIGATAEEIARLRAGGDPSVTQTYRSPVAGIVLEKMAVEGGRFMPGEALFRIADLSQLALLVEIPVADLAGVRVGSHVQATFEAWPAQAVSGRIDFIYPTVDAATRTVEARVLIDNQRHLPAGLQARVVVEQGAGRHVTVAESAVVDSGARQVVLVARGGGRYVARTVKTGARADGYVAIEQGLDAGEQVVVAANFLLDSESNLQAALRSFGSKAAP